MTHSASKADSDPPHSCKKVLLLEDDRFFGEFLCEFLSMRGYRVTMMPDGEPALGEIARSDFDLIVCDMQLPKLGGADFYRSVEKLRPDLCGRFVFITGNGFDQRVREFIRQIGGVLLLKPFHVNELFRALEKLERD